MKVIEGGFGKTKDACASELFASISELCKAEEDDGISVQGVGLIAIKDDVFAVVSNTDTLEESQVILAIGSSMVLDIITNQYRGKLNE